MPPEHEVARSNRVRRAKDMAVDAAGYRKMWWSAAFTIFYDGFHSLTILSRRRHPTVDVLIIGPQRAAQVTRDAAIVAHSLFSLPNHACTRARCLVGYLVPRSRWSTSRVALLLRGADVGRIMGQHMFGLNGRTVALSRSIVGRVTTSLLARRNPAEAGIRPPHLQPVVPQIGIERMRVGRLSPAGKGGIGALRRTPAVGPIPVHQRVHDHPRRPELGQRLGEALGVGQAGRDRHLRPDAVR